MRGIVLTTVAILAIAAGLSASGEPEQASAVPESTAGLTVYKDPATGRLMPVPPEKLEELVSEELRKTVSMSHEGLRETVAPGGGMMIDLQGRFQNAMQVRIGPGGQVFSDCGHAGPTPSNPAPEPPKE